jgi:septal ring-binding cell division protein DamX
MRIPKKGSLAVTNLIAILSECSETVLTGMVRVETGAAVKVVYLQQGTIAYASSNDRSDRLTEVLKRAGKLSQEQIDHAQERIKPGVSLGKTLVELGYLTSKELLWGARTQVEGIIHQLLFWKTGNYQILQGPLPKEIISLNASVHQVIFSGIMKSQDRRWVLERIGSPETVYTLSEEFHLKDANFRLPIETVASRINGKRSLNEIAHSGSLDAFEVCKTVAAMEILGMARPAKEKPHQMSLAVEETVKATEKKRLGEILQIPTVEQLQQEAEQKPTETAAASQEPEAAVSEEAAKRIDLEKPQGLESNQLEADSEEGELDNNQVVFVPTDIPERRQNYPSGLYSSRSILLICAAILLGVMFFFLLSYLLGGNKSAGKNHGDFKSSLGTQKAKSGLSTKEVRISPQTLIQSGQLQEAALIWKSSLSAETSKFTLQLILACQEKTVLDTIHALGDSTELMIVPVKFKGQTCYRMLYGMYPSESDAVAARMNLPELFEKSRIQAQIVPVARIVQ